MANHRVNKQGYRINKCGAIIDGFEKQSFKSPIYLGLSVKQEGIYYFFSRKQQNLFVYLPD